MYVSWICREGFLTFQPRLLRLCKINLNGSRQSRTATHETVSTGVSKKRRLFYASLCQRSLKLSWTVCVKFHQYIAEILPLNKSALCCMTPALH